MLARKYHFAKPTLKKGRVDMSKRVTDRIKEAIDIRSAVDSQRKYDPEGFQQRFKNELREGEELPDMMMALEVVARSVERERDALMKADAAYCRQAARRLSLYEACVYVARWEVYPEVVEVRREIDGRYGRQAGRRVHGLTGHTMRKPKRLLPQLEHMLLALEQRRGLPDPKTPGPPGELDRWRTRLEPLYEKLAQMMDELQTAEYHEQALRNDRDYELDSFDITYGQALAFLRATFTLSGSPQKVIQNVPPDVRRRRLKKKARNERQARAEGLRGGAKTAKNPPERRFLPAEDAAKDA